MKWFVLHPLSTQCGVVFDSRGQTRDAIILTPEQAKFMATFKGVREAKR